MALGLRMLRGVLIREGVKSAKNLVPDEILVNDACAVIIDEESRIIYLWVGDDTSVTDRFKAARIAQMLNWKMFGGAARIVQDKDEIKHTLTKFARIDEEIPYGELKLIIG